MTMFNGIDTDKATLIASQKEPDRGGYRSSLYRAEDGRLFIRGVHEERQKLPPSMRRATTTLMETNEGHARKWLVWNGYPELVERVFPEMAESQPSFSILKSGPISGADRRENAGGGSPDPGKVSGGNAPGQAGKGPDEKLENPISQGENQRNEGQKGSKQPDFPGNEGSLVKNALFRAGISENDQLKSGENPKDTVENPIIRDAIRRTASPGTLPIHDIQDDGSPLVKDALHRRETGENARGHGGEMHEGTGENPVLRDAERRRGTGGSSPSTDGGNPLVRDAIRRNRAEGSTPGEEETKPEETEGEKKPEKDDEANQDQGEKETEKTDDSASGDGDKDSEKAEEGAVVRDAMRRRDCMTGDPGE